MEAWEVMNAEPKADLMVLAGRYTARSDTEGAKE